MLKLCHALLVVVSVANSTPSECTFSDFEIFIRFVFLVMMLLQFGEEIERLSTEQTSVNWLRFVSMNFFDVSISIIFSTERLLAKGAYFCHVEVSGLTNCKCRK